MNTEERLKDIIEKSKNNYMREDGNSLSVNGFDFYGDPQDDVKFLVNYILTDGKPFVKKGSVVKMKFLCKGEMIEENVEVISNVFKDMGTPCFTYQNIQDDSLVGTAFCFEAIEI